MNLGVRWDVETGFGERHDHWATFDPNVINPISSQVGMTVRGGAQFLGADGNPSRTSPTFYNKIGRGWAPPGRSMTKPWHVADTAFSTCQFHSAVTLLEHRLLADHNIAPAPTALRRW